MHCGARGTLKLGVKKVASMRALENADAELGGDQNAILLNTRPRDVATRNTRAAEGLCTLATMLMVCRP